MWGAVNFMLYFFVPRSVSQIVCWISRRLAEDCASFEDCRIIASALSSLFEVSSRWDQCMSDSHTFSTLMSVLVKFVDDEGFSLPVG
jgi:hypothetical protein